ncbi:MAG: DNA gyrase/topoisomerase IV [Harvfovirus sp.]|uniref:DNA topoisomerase 2 n=1 Tax=Harvfovirus sp. TaxID=2487768 RepID=A0A3G5A1C7_9VIRU|nr:MAG: DNA gyrase/topoisomerase IV [Harvfovirus sp.]
MATKRAGSKKANVGVVKGKVELTVEEKFKKKSLHEHILLLPDSYIGSVKPDNREMWINSNDGKIILKDIIYPPGLYKIFDEILVNARDHSVRDATCKIIKVSIDRSNNSISCFNDGNGVPTVIHQDVGKYVPEMIFGELLTGENYETEGKIVGGKNGYGAKLANIYSTEFIVETQCKVAKKRYYQRFTNNMYTVEDPIITDVKGKQYPFTKITFSPDLSRFDITSFSDDIVALFEKRVLDLAACTRSDVSVFLNDKLIKKDNSFEDYIKLYYDNGALGEDQLIYQEFGERWRVGVIFDNSCGFRQVSFVNGICTYQGGTHVTHVLEQIVKELMVVIKEKNKDIAIKGSYIRDNLTLFIDCVIEDPSFTSQSKEFHSTEKSKFGSKCEIDANFIKRLGKTGIVDEVINLAQFKHDGELSKTDFKKSNNVKSIEKLEDAHWAGGAKAKLCYLLITEGDSAASFARAGLDVVGRERYGIFRLRGKFLNVREATVSQLLNNAEFKNLKQILGLKQGKKYDNGSKLRYGGIIILTDQDVDGSHIKGLLINMLHNFWPSLLKLDGYIKCMSTPIIKVFKKADLKKNQNELSFYTLSAYQKWVKETFKDDTSALKSKYHVKYYKGLGTSKDNEARAAFNDFEKKLINYVWETYECGKVGVERVEGVEGETDDIDEESVLDDGQSLDETDAPGEDDLNDLDDINSKSHNAITLAFEKSRANDRKKWLSTYNKDDILDVENKHVTYSDFVNKELIHFSTYDNYRSIPSLIDGFKPSHRKILFGCFKKKIINDEIKVAQLGAYIAEHTLYHHGEQSLYDAITNMGQTFVGSNNVNLLCPNGNFGNRIMGGKDAASPRYIFTQINKITTLLFKQDDEPIYKYVEEDGNTAEPEKFAPILPFILVNGTDGIGTGFSTSIPPYNPLDIVRNIKILLAGDPTKNLIPMMPWFRGFKGEVKALAGNKVQTKGHCVVVDERTVKVTELPIGLWTDNYNAFLNSVSNKTVDAKPKVAKGVKAPKATKTPKSAKVKFVESFQNDSGNNKINFTIVFNEDALQDMIKSNTLEKSLKLINTISLNNMYLFNSKDVITKYSSTEDIIIEFYKYRLEFYRLRKEYVTKLYANELKIIESKIKYIECLISDKIVLKKKVDEDDLIKDLKKLGFVELSYNITDGQPSFRYLTDMKATSQTINKIAELKQEFLKQNALYQNYVNTTIQQLWERELDDFVAEYNNWLVQLENEENDTVGGKGKKRIRKAVVKQPKVKK